MNNLLIGGGAIAGIVCGAVIVLAIVILAVWYVSTYNKLKRVDNMVDEGWATIDVHLKKR